LPALQQVSLGSVRTADFFFQGESRSAASVRFRFCWEQSRSLADIIKGILGELRIWLRRRQVFENANLIR
jgi:hypothetical protein